MAREITVRLIWRGEAVETLPEEARDYLRGCLTADMSAYYAAHPADRAALEGAAYFEPDTICAASRKRSAGAEKGEARA